MSTGRSVRLFLADGKATGILTAEIMNWTGHVLAAPRTRFEDAFTRLELRRTGVYFLIGPDEDTDLDRVYVGEGDEIGKRLYSHNKDKDFWERFVAVTSKDMNLTKAHVRYLEGRLLSILKEAKKAKIENKDIPTFDLLPEGDIADMETFLEEIQLILPVIGIEFLRQPAASKPDKSSAIKGDRFDANEEVVIDASFVLSNEKAGIEATAREEAGEFVLEAGSVGSLKDRVSFNETLRSRRHDALATGLISALNNKNFVLEQDISFSSPSSAAVFLFGTSRNGRTDWIVKGTNVPYRQWKDQMIDRNIEPGNM